MRRINSYIARLFGRSTDQKDSVLSHFSPWLGLSKKQALKSLNPTALEVDKVQDHKAEIFAVTNRMRQGYSIKILTFLPLDN